VVATREILIELFDMVDEQLSRRGVGVGDVMPDRQAARELLRSVPSSDVAVALKTQMRKNGQRAARWSTNDVHDTDALALAVPYCAVVVTAKHAADALRRAALPGRYGTALLTDLDALPERLNDGE